LKHDKSSPNFRALKRDKSTRDDDPMHDESFPANVSASQPLPTRQRSTTHMFVDTEMRDEESSTFCYEKL